MRIALAPDGPVGLRAGRVLLADGRVTAVGALGADVQSRDPRAESIDSPSGWDLLVSDAGPEDSRLAAAVDAGVPIISSHIALSELLEAAHLVSGASIEYGLPASLAVSALEQFDVVEGVNAAVTTSGKPLSRGHAVSFPAPIGPRWAEPAESPAASPKGFRLFSAPYDGSVVGVSIRVEGKVDGTKVTTSQAIVDDPLFLGAIALAGAALMLIGRAPPVGRLQVHEFAGRYLEACTAAGMGIASFSPAS